MVHRSSKSSTKVTSKRNKTVKAILDVVLVLLVAGATYAMFMLTNVKPENQEVNNPEVINTVPVEEDEEEVKSVKTINLQSFLDTWRSTFSTGIKVGVVIYDLDNDLMSGELNSNDRFNTASIYKLFVVYEGYRKIVSGEWDGNDGSYGELNTLQCLDLSIRESHSACAETILAKMGKDYLDGIIKNEYHLDNTSIFALTSTPQDVKEMLKIYYQHADLNDDAWNMIKDSMLNQPITDPFNNCEGACNWRQGLPKGFSAANVYNKTGWNWDEKVWTIYNDAAIVEFPEQNRHFIVVLMSSGFPSTRKIAQFGTELENELLKNFEED